MRQKDPGRPQRDHLGREPLGVLGALLLPLRYGDLDSLEVGKTVFLHKSAPKGWWDEQSELMRKHPGPGEMLARLALAPYTMSETMQKLEPLGLDRWPFELALKYGMRDRLSCPVGGRWLFAYWSRSVLSRLSQEERALLFLGATFAAIRLQRLSSPNLKRMGKGASLTARELAVLRLLGAGKRMRAVADERPELGGARRLHRGGCGRCGRPARSARPRSSGPSTPSAGTCSRTTGVSLLSRGQDARYSLPWYLKETFTLVR